MTERRYRADELTYAQMSAEPDWGPRLARASIHEAGHAVVAHALGLDGRRKCLGREEFLEVVGSA